jgi:hypothetical protein
MDDCGTRNDKGAPNDILRQFEEITQAMKNSIVFAILQNQALVQTSDTFLPKLMNGRL